MVDTRREFTEGDAAAGVVGRIDRFEEAGAPQRVGQDAAIDGVAGIDALARSALARTLGAADDPTGQRYRLDVDLADGYGLTSLQKVLLLMSACEDTGVSLSAFAEPDVARIRSLAQLVEALAAAGAVPGDDDPR